MHTYLRISNGFVEKSSALSLHAFCKPLISCDPLLTGLIYRAANDIRASCYNLNQTAYNRNNYRIKQDYESNLLSKFNTSLCITDKYSVFVLQGLKMYKKTKKIRLVS